MSLRVRPRPSIALAACLVVGPLSLLGATQASAAPGDPVVVQVLATNDFHGRIANDPSSSSAGAAVLAGAVESLRTANPNTVFAAAGDLIGASTFESFIANDKPTIDALNDAGLEVSAVGNHEFDQGYDDLVDRVMAPYDATTNPEGGAEWTYLGANVKLRTSGDPALEATWIKEMEGIEVGFVGAVTEHLPELVSPAGIADIEVTDIVEATNDAADDLVAEGADVVVLLVHEGSGTTSCETMDDSTTSDFGSIIAGVNDNVDAIVSGHTHLAYNCSFPVAGWADRAVKERPVVSAGQYGSNLNQLTFTVDPTTGAVTAKTQELLKLKAANGGPFNYPEDESTKALVAAAVAESNVLGAQPLGRIAAPFDRARFGDGTTANRGGESTLGNLVAEVQRWATRGAESGAAQIAFMNPGGLREDLRGTGDPRVVSYKQAATVQPFANTLVNMDLTGAQIKQVLEQQWQPDGASRPFLKLGMSRGFAYTYDPSKGRGERITAMYLDNVPIAPATTYSVTVNSFLASGGDNFTTLNEGAGKQDTGKSDLQAMVDYLAEFADAGAGDAPLPSDYEQQAVGITFPDTAPATYQPGQQVTFDVSSWAMTGENDVRDESLQVRLGSTSLGTFPVTTTLSEPADANSNDEAGTASVTVTLPANLTSGVKGLVLSGPDTGTATVVPVTVLAVKTGAAVTIRATPRRVVAGETRVTLAVSVRSAGRAATGTVVIRAAGKSYTRTLREGRASVRLPAFARAGTKTVTVSYGGSATVRPTSKSRTIRVVR